MKQTLFSVLAAIAIAGCAGMPSTALRRADPPHPPHGAGVQWTDAIVTGAGGAQLFVQGWRPEAGAIRGTVVIHHGLVDHSDRYAGFAERLARGGYAVWAFDIRGHGRTPGRRIHVDRIDQMLDDHDAVIAHARAGEPGAPVFVLGHSIGGLVVALHAIERPGMAGVILLAPGIAFEAPVLQAGGLQLIAALAPDAKVLATPHGDFSSSAEVDAELDRDPLIHQGNGPARTARAATDGISRVWARPEALVAPLLVVHGSVDKLTAPSGSRDLVARAGASDKRLVIYDGYDHDLMHEPNGGAERVAGDLHAWLDAHTGGAALPPPAALPKHLRGDVRAMTASIDLDVRGEHARDDALDDPIVTGGMRLRIGIGRIGWYGGLDLRTGVEDGWRYEADAYLLGGAVRLGDGGVLSLTAGVGAGGVRGRSATRVPVELAVELPAGPVRLLARATAAWRLSGPEWADDAFGIADEATAQLGIRLGRDRRYWARVTGGAGPFVALSYRNLGGVETLGVALGIEIWGGR